MTEVLQVTTAEPKDSIWTSVGHEAFRKKVADLKRINELPGGKLTHRRIVSNETRSTDAQYTLPFEIERKLADDFALLASFKEEQRTVSAATLQEDRGRGSLKVYVAANERLLPTVKLLFDEILVCLRDCAKRTLSRERCQQRMIDSIVKFHRLRIHGKIRSKLWKPSRSEQKGAPQLRKMLQIYVSTGNRKVLFELRDEADALQSLLLGADSCVPESTSEHQLLRAIILQSHRLCLRAVQLLKADQTLENSKFRPIKKIARYWTICESMADAARRYSSLFRQIEGQQLPAYSPQKLPASPYSPALACRVHAEIQLIVHHALNPTTQNSPRVIGGSKSACYLCSLFIHKDNQYFVTRTHGRLYDQWTVPDVFNGLPLTEQRLKFRRVLAGIDAELSLALEKAEQSTSIRPVKLVLPNESDATLPTGVPRSLLPSEAGTIPSHQSSSISVAILAAQLAASRLPAVTEVPQSQHANASSKELALKPKPNDVRSHRSSAKDTSIDSLHPAKRFAPQSKHHSSPSIEPSNVFSGSSSSFASQDGSDQHSSQATIGPPSSPSTVDSWEFPLTHTISSKRPLKTSSQNMHITFELEAGDHSGGTVKVSNAPRIDGKAIKNTIDVSRMAPGDERVVKKSESEEDLVVNLQNGEKSGMTQVTFKWD